MKGKHFAFSSAFIREAAIRKRKYVMECAFPILSSCLEPVLQGQGENFGLLMSGIASIHSIKRQAKPLSTIEAQIQRAIARIAESDCPVLIAGERGAGKRTIAAQIHAQSHRSRGPFIEVRCGDTGGDAPLAALDTKGTVYLVEVTELSVQLQESIVQAHFRSEQPLPCRLLCGTSRDLDEEVRSWRMREDFYYLISAVTLRIPPLRCRKPEILSIADDLLTQYSKQFGRPKPVLDKELAGFLLEHPWPDNLIELETAIKTFVAIGDQAISLAAIRAASPSGRLNGHRKSFSLKEATRASSVQIERQLISEVLLSTGGNRKRAASELGISYKALLYKLKQIGAENKSASSKNGAAK
jgi:two-component system response regulator PilR (NtrC family)